MSFCATGSVNATTWAPPMVSRPPLYPKMPTSLNVFFGSSVSTPTVSPTWMPAAWASAAFTAISSSACGPCPSRSCTRSEVPVQFVPSRGGPNVVTTLPFAPMTRAPSAWAVAVTVPTPGTARTFATRSTGTVATPLSSGPSWTLTTGLADTDASMSE